MKYNVRFYLHTFVDFEVEAASEKEAIDMAENLEYDMDQILDNMVPDNETDVTEIENKPEEFKTKVGWYSAILKLVQKTGCYLLIKEEKRPSVTFENGLINTTIRVKSLFICDDETSPLQVISDRDKRYDADDFFSKENLETIYSAIKNIN